MTPIHTDAIPVHVLSMFMVTCGVSTYLYASELHWGFPSPVVLIDRACVVAILGFLTQSAYMHKIDMFQVTALVLGVSSFAIKVFFKNAKRDATMHLTFRICVGIFAQLTLLKPYVTPLVYQVIPVSGTFYYVLGLLLEFYSMRLPYRFCIIRYLVSMIRTTVVGVLHMFTIIAITRMENDN